MKYKCEICGAEYDNILDRSDCEAWCYKRQQAKIKAQKEKELNEQRQSRKEEINKDIIAINDKIEQFNKDYPNSKMFLVHTVDNTYSFADLMRMFG